MTFCAGFENLFLKINGHIFSLRVLLGAKIKKKTFNEKSG